MIPGSTARIGPQATCVDCHLPRDSFVNKMLAKARDGYNHSVAMTFKTYGPNLRISSDAARRIQENCIACHREIGLPDARQ